MLYTLSAGYPFFWLQISVTFAGIYFKLGDLMSACFRFRVTILKVWEVVREKTSYAYARSYALPTA